MCAMTNEPTDTKPGSGAKPDAADLDTVLEQLLRNILYVLDQNQFGEVEGLASAYSTLHGTKT
jgi:hypothetical protein